MGKGMSTNTDIRIEVSFKGHRKRRKLRLLLGAGSTDYLIDLWINTATNHPDGVLAGMDAMDVALEAGWEGEPEKFVNAMLDAGFLDQDENGTFRLHDWEDHQPWVIGAPARSQKAKKAAETRWGKERAKPEGCSTDATSMQGAQSENAGGNAPAFPFLPEELKNKAPLPPAEIPEAKAATSPASPEDDPDVQPNAEISDLSECLIEFQELARVYQQAGGCVDTVTAYKAFLPMRQRFPMTRVVDDIAKRSQSDAWKRQDIPTKLSTYLGRRMWLDGPPASRASPSARGKGGDGPQDWMRYAGSCVKGKNDGLANV